MLLGAVLMIVAGVTFLIYAASTGMGSDVGNKVDNTFSGVENALIKAIFR